MLKKTGVKIGIVIMIIVLIGISTNVFGAINEDYYNQVKEDLNVIDGNLDSKVKSSVLLDAIAILVYTVGSLLESVLGGIFTGISGQNIFPWADAILFNAVPLLDINIFNPSGASLVAVMQEFIASSYWTVFTLACTFLGIAIMVTAIKLVISTIASDKAMYKQAILNWLKGFIMLWGIHFFISFVLYLNEGLVEMASNIASEATKGSKIDLMKLRETTASDYDIVYNFVEAMTDATWNISSIVGLVVTIVGIIAVIVLVVVSFVPSGGSSGAAVAGAAGAAAGAGTAGAATGWAAFAAGVAKFGSVAIAVGKISIAVGSAGLGGYMMSQGIDSMSQTEFVTLQYDAIEAVRNTVIAQFKDGSIFDKFDQHTQSKLSGDPKDKTTQFLFFKDPAAIASRLLTSDSYVNSIQARVGDELRADAEKIVWKDYTDVDAVYGLAADVYLIMNDTYTLETTKYDEDGNEDGTVKEEISYKIMLENYLTCIRAIEPQDKVIRIVDMDNWETVIQSNNPAIEEKDENVNHDQMLEWYCEAILYGKADYEDRVSGGDGVENKSNIISTLAKAFKDMAWTNTTTSWKPSKPVIQGALLYAILVAQSLIFFISYAKRLFYVIILILLAPVVVVYDFFTKFSS